MTLLLPYYDPTAFCNLHLHNYIVSCITFLLECIELFNPSTYVGNIVMLLVDRSQHSLLTLQLTLTIN